ncbi:TSUP family transporter [Maridesulfovibrio sp.]|uniref:TSUP family transporter n=1 Tax=Maridesulfovibrio sp. TaxID=2795000 RepID=UPI0029F4EDCB|nr:TSUP family transporter [Maridesulfovibrio sp.]
MYKPSGRTILFFCAALFMVCAALLPTDLIWAADIKIPEYIDRINNPYILPDGNGPGFFKCAIIGMVTGMLSAAIGAGGGLLVVPALMTAGVSGIYAVGSEMFRMFIFSTIESVRMGINRRIKYVLALIMSMGTLLGGLGGYALNNMIFIADPAGNDIFISSIIALWLIIYAFIIIPDFRADAHKYALELLRKEKEKQSKSEAVSTAPNPPAKQQKDKNGDSRQAEGEVKSEAAKEKGNDPEAKEHNPNTSQEPQFEDELYPDEEPWEIARSLRRIKLPPYMEFPSTLKNGEGEELEPADLKRNAEAPTLGEVEQDKQERIPVIPIFLITIVGGFFMSITGSGGVILTFTLMTKAFACVAALVAGTDLARLAISSGGLTLGAYGLNGFINIYCITGLVFGTISGLHLGSKGLKHILPYRVKGLVSLLVISVIINRLLALPALLRKAGADIYPGLVATLDSGGSYILLIGALIFGGWIIFAFLSGVYNSLQPVKEKGADK